MLELSQDTAHHSQEIPSVSQLSKMDSTPAPKETPSLAVPRLTSATSVAQPSPVSAPQVKEILSVTGDSQEKTDLIQETTNVSKLSLARSPEIPKTIPPDHHHRSPTRMCLS